MKKLTNIIARYCNRKHATCL